MDPGMYNFRIYVKIRFSQSGYRALAETVYYKNDMTVPFFGRWEWFFKYRAALLQVEYPKAFVEIQSGSYKYVLPSEEQRSLLENRIRSAKGKVTELERKMHNAASHWNEIFPIEQHPLWVNLVEKKKRYEAQLIELENEYEPFKTIKAEV